MRSLVKNECKKIFLPVMLTTLIMTIAMCLLSCTVYKSYSLQYELEAWEVGTEIFDLIYPLVVTVPLCWNLYCERKNGFLIYVKPRVNLTKYLMSKWIAYALGSICMIVIPYIVSAVFALYVKAPIDPFENPFHHVFQSVFIEQPLLYAILLSCWKGAVSLLVMTFGFVLALYSKNIFVIMTGSFIYSILENYVLSILGLEAYRLVVCFEPTSVAARVVTSLSFVAGPVLLSAVICLTAFLLSRKNAVVSV